MSAVMPLIYPVSYLTSFLAFILTPTSRARTRLISRVALAFFMLMAVDALFAGLLTIAHIPTNLVSASVLHFVLSIICVALIFRNRGVQSFEHDLVDWCALIALACVALICGRAEFGPDLTIHWLASDAAVHLDRIRSIVETDSVRGMYVAWNFMAPWVEITSMFVGSTAVYKALIFGDVSILYFGGLLFYSLMNTIVPDADKKRRGLFLIVAVIYLLGYPLNCMIYGFFYLNVGVFMAVSAVIICTRLVRKTSVLDVMCMALSLFGLINSYALFAPTMFGALFISLTLAWHRQGRLLCAKTIAAFVLVFAVTGILGIYFTYFGTFPSTGSVTASSAISWNGGIYRNLYSNQLLLLPFALAALWSQRRHLLEAPAPLTLLACGITVLGAFLLTFSHTISTYYFFKFYFLLSPFIIAVATYGILYILEHGSRELLVSSAIVVAMISLISISGVDQKLVDYSPGQDYGVVASYHPALDIYTSNYSLLRTAPEFDPEALELYEEADRLTNTTDRPIGFLGNIEQYYWWCALIRQREARQRYTAELRPWSTDTPLEACENMAETCSYVLILTREPFESVGSSESREAATILAGFDHDVVYRNDAGYIIRLSPMD